MIYKNPIIKGFYPDPSVCSANNKFYMVCSSFQYFPGVPIFESSDLVNWQQIGHCLTRESQIQLEKIPSSGGVFAPTIRYNNGRFYMVTTNDTLHRNFYVYTDDIYGEWSEPIFVDQDGIDPSLYFEDGRAFFISNGTDDNGIHGIVQCEIDIASGKKLTPSKTIWQGSGGRYLESPHMYKINGMYYLTAAEGGTEYGHMITYARSSSIWDGFTGYSGNPVLTNRNLGGFELQGMGHGELVQDNHGNWHMIHLGFRQSGQWSAYHHLGREVFMTPVKFGSDGWFTAGTSSSIGTTQHEYEISGDFTQNEKKTYTFENTDFGLDWCFLRIPHMENYNLASDTVKLKGTDISLDEADSPTFICLRQRDFKAEMSCTLELQGCGEAGITLYMDEQHHYDLALKTSADGVSEAVERLNIGDVKSIQNKLPAENKIRLVIRSDNFRYYFIDESGNESYLGSGQTRYLSSEVAGGFTGVVIGLYAVGSECTAIFTDFKCEYK